MQKHYYGILPTFALLGLLVGSARAQSPGAVDGQFETTLSGTTFTVTVQLRATPGDQGMGTSTIQFTYDNTALDYVSASYDNYSGNQTSHTGGFAGYNSTITQPNVDEVSLNIDLGFTSDGNGQALGSAFTDVATVTFTVTDDTKTANLSFDEGTEPDGIAIFNGPGAEYTKGTFTDNDASLAAVLPVTLTNLGAVQREGHAEIRWETLNETNNDGFEIQRRVQTSAGPQPWKTVGFVAGHGTTSAPQSYHFTDTSLPFDTRSARYRLRQIDTDGRADLSGEVPLTVAAPDALKLHGNYPDPFNPVTTIRYEVPTSQPVRIAVYDMLGRSVRVLAEGPHEAGRFTVNFDAGDLPSGVYFYRIETRQGVYARSMLLMK